MWFDNVNLEPEHLLLRERTALSVPHVMVTDNTQFRPRPFVHAALSELVTVSQKDRKNKKSFAAELDKN